MRHREKSCWLDCSKEDIKDLHACGRKLSQACFYGDDMCELNKKLVCYCGHDCSKCVTYLATKNTDEKLREQSQRFYKEEFGQDIPLEKFICFGGRSDNVFELCLGCPFRKCCKEHSVEACEECSEYPCQEISEYQTKYVNKCNQV